MTTYTKVMFSSSTNGKSILLSGTATPGTMIHTPPTGTSGFDEVWLYGMNTSTTPTKVTLEWGETTAPNGNIEVTIPGEAGLVLIVPGLVIQNSLPIRAFAGTANVITILGFINRIT